jgi:ATP-dependent RNA helicase DeaD
MSENTSFDAPSTESADTVESGSSAVQPAQVGAETVQQAPAAEAPVETPAADSAAQAPASSDSSDSAKSSDSEDPNQVLFTDLDLDPRILAALRDVGYEKPSPIQAATIPTLLAGQDVVGLAQTGTGKTAAFALPVLSKLAELSEINGPSGTTKVLVLAPTRELALQVAEAFTSYAKYMDSFSVLPVYGGSAYGPQLAGLRRGAQVVVGTPGRVIDHLSKGSLDLSELSYLVLDEADEMLRMGFADDVEKILADTPKTKQVALFSATMPRQIRKIAQQYLNNPAEITVKNDTRTAANIRQRYVQVMGPRKLDAMTRILESEDSEGVIAFVRTKMATEDLADKLKARGYQAAAINGDIPQQQRERTVEALRDGKIDILVATDVAARGLDVERVSHVFNYDIPHDTESYVHRIGRTGRAGRKGDAILFMTPREKYLLRSIERATKSPVEQMELPSVEHVNNRRLARFAEEITKTLDTQDLDVFRELVTQYDEQNEATPLEVAAALAFMAQGGRSLLLEDVPMAPAKQARERGERHSRDGMNSRGPSRALTEGNATYRLAVGRKDRVLPGSIVGAIANEGGLSSAEIGGIDIRADHTLVELPANLTPEQLETLSQTRIGGKRIHLELDNGRRPAGDRDDRGSRGFDRDRAPRKFDGDRGPRKFDDRGPREGGFDRDRAPRKFDGDRGPRKFDDAPRGDRGGFGGGSRDGGFRSDRAPRKFDDAPRGDRGGFGGRGRTEGDFRSDRPREDRAPREGGFGGRGRSEGGFGGNRDDRGGFGGRGGRGGFGGRDEGTRGNDKSGRKPRW